MSIDCEEHLNLINCINIYSKIRKHFYDLQDYLKGYEEIIKEHTKKLQSFSKRQNPKIEYPDNASSNSDFNLSFITKFLNLIIKTQISTYQKISEGINTILENSLKLTKEQDQFHSRSMKIFELTKSDLCEKYKKVDKFKNAYFSHATNAEKILVKVYQMKRLNIQFNANDEENLKTSLKESLKKMKLTEKEYKEQIKFIKSFEDSFINGIEELYNITQIFSKEIIENVKTVIMNTMVSIKSALTFIIMEEDTYMPLILDSNPKEKFEKFLKDILLKDKKPFMNITPQVYSIKILDKFKKQNQVDINNDNDLNYNNNNYLINSSSGIVASADSLTFDDIHQIVKTLYNYISIKDDNMYNIEKEGNKILINKICNQLLIEEETMVEKESIDTIKGLLKDSRYRKLFLQKLNDLRGKGIFKLEEKNFLITGDLLNIVLEYGNSESDFYAIKNLIILSQTFYYQKNGKDSPKLYLQSLVQRNPIVQSKEFWEKFISYSITNEVRDMIETEQMLSKGFKKSTKDSKEKSINIVFAQLLALSDNLIEFGVGKEVGKEVVKPIMDYYGIPNENQEVVLQILSKERTTIVEIDEFFSSPLPQIGKFSFEEVKIDKSNNNNIK